MIVKALRLMAQIFLHFLSFLWESSYRIWRFCYSYGLFRQNVFEVPIISVGNLTFGGTGKTPFVVWLAEFLGKRGKKVMILMRGYKGRAEHSSGFLKGGRRMRVNPAEYGDEALLLSRKLKDASIVVGKRRGQNLDYYFEKELPDVVLLDDGHQHLKLRRNLNIVLFDSLMPLERYKVAPAGYMREGLSALSEADIIVLNRADQVSLKKLEALEKLIDRYKPREALSVRIGYRPMELICLGTDEKLKVSQLKGRKVVCVAGIASTEGFYNMVESLGADIVKKYSFPDHHFFKSHEIDLFLREAEELDSYIVTTEKDVVKMRRFINSDRIFYLKIKIQFLSGEDSVQETISRVMV